MTVEGIDAMQIMAAVAGAKAAVFLDTGALECSITGQICNQVGLVTRS